MQDPRQDIPQDPAAGDAYALYRRGMQLLEEQHFMQAALSLEQARDIEPDKASIREALGRAYFRAASYAAAAEEFAKVLELHPVSDYAHFCLGRSYEKLGDRRAASRHFTLACGMAPKRQDYKIYRDRLRGD